ncbi:MAG: S-layer homology domain-containing protein, partial [Firmicutes bacterium]|nr:S-layer homology domain-containing protein [Bacillota bacterium]
MKRNIAILFAAAVLSAQSAYAAEKKDWTDHWASAAIGKWYEQGLAKGVENGDFQPDREITRAEFVTLANRCMNFTKTADTNFNDISGTWFEPQVKIAAAAGYISGYPDNSFRPANAVTRAEAASIITGLLGLDKNNAQENVQSFDDYEDIPEWSRSAVGAAYREGFIKGYPDNTFRAERSLTRAEAVTLLDNIISGTAVAVDTTENTADESDKYSGEEKIWIGWLIDYDCVGADPSKHKQECNLMESCIESGEGILLTDTSSTNNAGVWIPFDSESQKQAAGLNKSLAANKYIPTIRVTGHLVANDLASDAGKDTKYPDAIHLSSIEAVYISDISNDELKAFENVSPTDYKKTSDAGSSGAGSGSSSSLKTESGVTVTTEFSDLWTDNISVKVGESVKWYVNVPAGTNLNGCGATIKIPGLGWGTDSYNKEEGHLQLAEGSNLVYEFTPAEEADILFTCWMGSSCHKNYIHVTADG